MYAHEVDIINIPKKFKKMTLEEIEVEQERMLAEILKKRKPQKKKGQNKWDNCLIKFK